MTQAVADTLRRAKAVIAAEERERIAAMLIAEADLCPCAEDAKVLRDAGFLVRADFSYDAAEALAEAEEREP